MNRVKVAAIQMRCAASVEENLKKAEAMVRKAAAEGANVILLPELFEREYFCQQRRYDFYHLAKPVEERCGAHGHAACRGAWCGAPDQLL